VKIEELAKQMTEYAHQHPYNPDDLLKGVLCDEGCLREWSFNGVMLEIMFSINIHTDTLKFRSLSVGRKDKKRFSLDDAKLIASHFFQPKVPVIINPPNPILVNTFQFGQPIGPTK